MVRTKIFVALACIPFSWAIVGSAYAAGCDDYPMTAGEIEVRESPAGMKILATGAATVDFDDADEVIDATMEATLEAKAVIAKFFTETIQTEESIETAAVKVLMLEVDSEGTRKNASKEKVKATFRRLASHSEALLRGVAKLAECYTKNDRVMVTVGIKPETIAAAEALTGAIGESVAQQPTTTETNVEANASTESTDTSKQSGQSAKGPESYSKGADKLDDF